MPIFLETFFDIQENSRIFTSDFYEQEVLKH